MNSMSTSYIYSVDKVCLGRGIIIYQTNKQSKYVSRLRGIYINIFKHYMHASVIFTSQKTNFLAQ